MPGAAQRFDSGGVLSRGRAVLTFATALRVVATSRAGEVPAHADVPTPPPMSSGFVTRLPLSELPVISRIVRRTATFERTRPRLRALPTLRRRWRWRRSAPSRAWGMSSLSESPGSRSRAASRRPGRNAFLLRTPVFRRSRALRPGRRPHGDIRIPHCRIGPEPRARGTRPFAHLRGGARREKEPHPFGRPRPALNHRPSACHRRGRARPRGSHSLKLRESSSPSRTSAAATAIQAFRSLARIRRSVRRRTRSSSPFRRGRETAAATLAGDPRDGPQAPFLLPRPQRRAAPRAPARRPERRHVAAAHRHRGHPASFAHRRARGRQGYDPDGALRRRSLPCIGTHASNDLVLQDPAVSRFHCRLVREEGAWRVRDWASLNGTKLEAVRIRDADLPVDATLVVGDSLVRVRAVAPAGQTVVPMIPAFGQLAGTSLPMRKLFTLLEKVAPSDINVLIEGESGTGKELVANEIGQRSPRVDNAFVVVDCGAISPSLVESELFGHVRGSFVGADRDRVGAFEAADGGTVFLDEVGELPIELQPKLLRALEARARSGAWAETKTRKVNVRVISATNRDLEREVNRARFREDLYFRLAVMTVRLPPAPRAPRRSGHPHPGVLADAGRARPGAPLHAPGPRGDVAARLAGQRARAAELRGEIGSAPASRTRPATAHAGSGLRAASAGRHRRSLQDRQGQRRLSIARSSAA